MSIEPNTDPHADGSTVGDHGALTLGEAAKLVGTTSEALRLKIKRGTLQSVQVTGHRGKLVAGVTREALEASFPSPLGDRGAPVGPDVGPENEARTLQTLLNAERERREAVEEARDRTEHELRRLALELGRAQNAEPLLLEAKTEAKRLRSRWGWTVGAMGTVSVLAAGLWFQREVEAGTRTNSLQGQIIEAQTQALEAEAREARESSNRERAERQTDDLARSLQEARGEIQSVEAERAALEQKLREMRVQRVTETLEALSIQSLPRFASW